MMKLPSHGSRLSSTTAVTARSAISGRFAPTCMAVTPPFLQQQSQQLQQPQPQQVRWYQGKDPTGVDPEKSVYVQTNVEPIYKLGKHRSNAMELVRKVPIVGVDRGFAICDGGGGALGHPLQYIALPLAGDVRSCKYCSLRFRNSGKTEPGAHH